MRSFIAYSRRSTTILFPILIATCVCCTCTVAAQDPGGPQAFAGSCQPEPLGHSPRPPRESHPTSGESSVVTIQQINHRIPPKAHAEAIKAEKARLAHKTEEAVRHYYQAILIDPQFVAARNNLAFLFQESDPESAVKQLEEAVKIDPHNALLFRNLTIAYARSHRFDAAERAARTNVDLDRTGGHAALMLLGFALMDRQKFTDEALQCFDRSREEYADADLFAARVLMGQGKLATAKARLRTYLCMPEPQYAEVANDWLELIDRHEQKAALLLSTK